MGLALLLCAMLGQADASADLRPIPSMTALVEAHKLIEDVYGVSASVGFDSEGELFVLPKRYRTGSKL